MAISVEATVGLIALFIALLQTVFAIAQTLFAFLQWMSRKNDLTPASTRKPPRHLTWLSHQHIHLAMSSADSELVDHSAGSRITKIVQNRILMPSTPDSRRIRPRNTEGTSQIPWAAQPGRQLLDCGKEVTWHLSVTNGAMADGGNSWTSAPAFIPTV
ncbi:hypothetical protein CPAR01_05409 [Colletotrichum paranaense]|uniref:Uncharacterized protein n=1 Tax=Colletotrichum paranaense TaxID=1914294 RepID=A0ABQ9SR75_9PEZI|nr:uncharacterized protein CPAR01_05409 [Colletotrichum paranaense]KAK1542022.1 hypothetical protein CPAR01_05409 [Colletotrichum paranaense]